jgi:hypothetical protein
VWVVAAADGSVAVVAKSATRRHQMMKRIGTKKGAWAPAKSVDAWVARLRKVDVNQVEDAIEEARHEYMADWPQQCQWVLEHILNKGRCPCGLCNDPELVPTGTSLSLRFLIDDYIDERRASLRASDGLLKAVDRLYQEKCSVSLKQQKNVLAAWKDYDRTLKQYWAPLDRLQELFECWCLVEPLGADYIFVWLTILEHAEDYWGPIDGKALISRCIDAAHRTTHKSETTPEKPSHVDMVLQQEAKAAPVGAQASSAS